MAYEYFTNNALTTLAVAVEADATDIQPVDPTSFPGQGTFRIRVGSELMMVNSVAVYDMTVTKWIVERGIEGTTAAAHNPGTTARAVVTAEALQNLVVNSIPSLSNLTVTGENHSLQVTDSEASWYSFGNPISLFAGESGLSIFCTDKLTLETGGGAIDIIAQEGVVFIRNLPTSDPMTPGAIWNDGGTLKISL